MKKNICLILPMFLVISCNSKQNTEISESSLNENINIYQDIPLNVANKILNLDSYVAITSGNTKTDKIISYNQNIYSYVKKDHEYIDYYNKSDSFFVKIENHAFYYENNVIYKEKNDKNHTKVTFDEYYNMFGGLSINTPVIEGYIIDDSYINNVTLVTKNDDYCIYDVNIDGNEAGKYNKIQMKKYGNLNDYPIFENVIITMCITNDYIPIYFNLNATYYIDVPILGKTKCIQHYKTEYTNVNATVTIDNKDEYIKLID